MLLNFAWRTDVISLDVFKAVSMKPSLCGTFNYCCLHHNECWCNRNSVSSQLSAVLLPATKRFSCSKNSPPHLAPLKIFPSVTQLLWPQPACMQYLEKRALVAQISF